MTHPIAEQLRQQIALLRTRPTPLADMIPLMQRAADALDAQVQPPAVVEVPAGYAPTDAQLEIGRRAIEDVLIEWRDNGLSEVGRNNGLVIKGRDGSASSIIRFGPETALKIGIKAMLAAVPTQQGAEPSDALSVEVVFERYANAGYCLSLVFDDDGRWAVSDEGMTQSPMSEAGHTEPVSVSSTIHPGQWKPSIREAVAVFVNANPLPAIQQGSEPC